MKLGEAFIEVRPDTKRFRAELERDVTADASSIGRTLQQALVGGAFLAGAKKAVDAASDLNEAANVTRLTFGAAEDQVSSFAKTAAESIGQSEAAARQATATFGGLLVNLGLTDDEAAKTSITLTKLSSDLASAFNSDPADAALALSSALRGEQEPIMRYNVLLSDQAVRAKAVELGLAASTAAVDENGKVQARLALIMEQTSRVQGDFANTSGEAANAARISAAKTEDAAADLGANLLPIYTKLTETVGVLADAFGSLPEPVQTGLIALGGIVALSGPIRMAGDAVGGMVSIVRRSPAAFDRAAVGAFNLTGNLSKMASVAAGPAALALGIFAIAMFDAKQRADEMNRSAKELRDEVERTGDSLEDVALRKAVEDFTGDERTRDAMAKLGVSFKDLREPLQGSRRAYEEWLHALQEEHPGDARVEILARRVSEARGSLGAARDATDATGQAVADLGGDAAGAAPKVKELTDKLDANEQAAKDAAESVDLFREAVDKALRPLDLQGAVDERTQALQDIASGIDERRQAVEDARQRIADLKATKKEDRPEDFSRQLADAQAALREALDATSLTLDGNSEAALRNREELRNLVDDSVNVITTARDQGKSLDDLRLLRLGEIESLRTQLEQMGFNKEQIDVYIGAIKDIPLTRATTLTVETAKAQARIKDLADSLQALAPDQQLGIDAAIIDRNLQRASALANRAGYAAGGFPFDGDFLVHKDELLRKRGSDLEVIAGPNPSAVSGFDGVNEEQLLELRQQNRLLELLVANTTTSRTGALRAVKIDAGAI